ncbi:group II intron maturase-specific domain-containing protein [Microbulbifer sp.]|uniref:group II intron maturase-specific domain-containing protein n=1 Tax=Microbulbifer sp. TaxID=1908541 RepID=UPI00258E6F7C|nr:group II intron maturase-specific domain-containing protein [Microbulbifer sp.]
MIGHQCQATERGSPQGGVISPLISNVYLNAFDQHMKSRGHRIIRYADDILILCGSEPAAGNALKVATRYLEGELKLTVNRSKTHLTDSREGIAFLGVVIGERFTRIQAKKLQRLKEKLKELTRRNTGANLSEAVRQLNPVLRGFLNYFRIANCARVMKGLMGWLRRRLRAIQLKQWKWPSRLHRRLRQLGYRGAFKAIRMKSWHNAQSPLASYAMPNRWLHEELGLFDMSSQRVGLCVPVA